MKAKFIITLLALSGFTQLALAAPINVVAAENFYGELAQEIGGNTVKVQSIIDNPNADPHLFTTSPSTNKAMSQAQIIIYNGADYDPWMGQFLASLDKKKVTIIDVSSLMNVKSGANPHLWYNPATFPTVAKVLAAKFNQLSPTTKSITDKNLQEFLANNQQVTAAVNQIKAKHTGVQVTATEPVFGYMATAMGLSMQGLDFQWKIMNDSEPTPRMIVSYQDLLTSKKVKVMFYNNQVTDSITQNMQNLARKNGVAVVGVSETMPKNMTINNWLLSEIKATAAALNEK